MTSPDPFILSIENVHKSLPAEGGRPVEILSDISLHAPVGAATVVIGPSGGGKSTLVRLINRLEEPTAGRILLAGEDISSCDPLLLRRRVGLVLQKAFMFPGTVLENLQTAFRYRGGVPPGGDDPALLTALALCQLERSLLGREARSLSVGQQQRVSLARVLLTGPELLVLDEPTSALDRPTGDKMGEILHGICREGKTSVLMVTHDLRLAGRVADRLAYLEGGRILEEGNAQQLLKAPSSEELRRFLGEPREGEV